MPGLQSNVALLRAVNVSGKNLIPMKMLCAQAQALGLTQVQSYLQSGNLVFLGKPQHEQQYVVALEGMLLEYFGCQVPCLVMDVHEFERRVRANPLLAQAGVGEQHLHAGFLFGTPQALNPGKVWPLSATEQAVVRDQMLYLYCPDGMGRTKLTSAWIERNLEVSCTIRNWRTVTNLLAMLAATAT